MATGGTSYLVRPAGMSDEESERSDDDDIIFDFGLKKLATTKQKNRKRKKNKSFKQQSLVTESVPSTKTGNAGNSKILSFWQKKSLAFERFGEADIRPQDNYRDFILHRRQLNNGKWDEAWIENVNKDKVLTSQCRVSMFSGSTTNNLPDLYQNHFVMVNDNSTFQLMMSNLMKQKEVTLDFEANDDHSFLGMTAMIQIGTEEIDYLIDVFPLTGLLLTSFKEFLEDPSIIKYLFGANNDFLWMKRDYLAQIVSAIDVQIIFSLILEDGCFDEATKLVPLDVKSKWYAKYIGNYSASKEEKRRHEKKASVQPFGFEKIAELYYPGCEVDKVAQLADFRPRENKDTENYKKLLKYARDDVHVLWHIVDVLKCSIQNKYIFCAASEKTKTKAVTEYIRKNTSPPEYLPGARIGNVILQHSEAKLLNTILKWRNHHASIIDENPESLFTLQKAAMLIKNKPENLPDLEQQLYKKQGSKLAAPECLKTYSETLFQILRNGEEYFNKIMNIQCHNCRLVRGHAAWGCDEPWSTQSTKENLRENDEARRRQNNRRQKNKRRNKRLQRSAGCGNDEESTEN